MYDSVWIAFPTWAFYHILLKCKRQFGYPGSGMDIHETCRMGTFGWEILLQAYILAENGKRCERKSIDVKEGRKFLDESNRHGKRHRDSGTTILWEFVAK
ncbi:hypothetical protein KP509_25G066300 [Ceratopteris richardii]|uniref:Uncharacterized protein n=1 Tax=Ceratopteris richardii TaxID=49495 RepID=A0A8T2RTH4_CERRI|nr:hypothetical protein KP509_25G066300 [Ceratopteris richardii]